MTDARRFIEPLEPRMLLSAVQPAVTAPPVPFYGSVRSGGQVFSVGLVPANGVAVPIRPNRPTWIVIPGWQSSPATVDPLADAIQASAPRFQVLEFDWSSAANTPDVATAALRVPQMAAFVARALRRWGIPPGKINLVGHSLGGYMTDQIARRLSSGVNRVIALDPATIDIAGLNLSGTDFAAHSMYSVAFIGSSFSTPSAAFTADETIRANVGEFNSIASHLAVLDLFTNMMQADSSGSPDPVSATFSLPSLTPGARPNWLPNGVGEGYEATLTARQSDSQWFPQSLTYIDATTSQPATIAA